VERNVAQPSSNEIAKKSREARVSRAKNKACISPP